MPTLSRHPDRLLRRVRLELARDHDFPNGSRDRGYDFVAPIDEKGRVVADAWRELRDRCRVRRFWVDEKDEVGHLVHGPGGGWSFRYDIHGDRSHDETGFHFDTHKFEPGEYVSIREQDGVLRTFRVISVQELD
jgi:hypothetical protein